MADWFCWVPVRAVSILEQTFILKDIDLSFLLIKPLLQTPSLKSLDALFLVTVFCTTLFLASKEGNRLNHTEIGGLIMYSSLRNIWAYRTVNWPIKTQLLNQSGERGGWHTCSELVTNTQGFLLWTEYMDLRVKGLKVVVLLFSIISKCLLPVPSIFGSIGLEVLVPKEWVLPP